MHKHEFLAGLHRLLEPRSYLEIGVQRGRSLRLSRTRSIGIDPGFVITSELLCDLHLVRSTSDEFFARTDPLAHFEPRVIDLAFIDGMHLAEYAFRDVANVQRLSGATSAIVVDDTHPRSIAEAARDRLTVSWTGDVFKVTALLRRLQPELFVLELDTTPTGTVLVLGCDPASTALVDGYASIADELLAPDPQSPPESVLERSTAVDPSAVLGSNVWRQLRRLRGARAGVADVRAAIRASDLPGVSNATEMAGARR